MDRVQIEVERVAIIARPSVQGTLQTGHRVIWIWGTIIEERFVGAIDKISNIKSNTSINKNKYWQLKNEYLHISCIDEFNFKLDFKLL